MTQSSTVEHADQWSLERLTQLLYSVGPPEQTSPDAADVSLDVVRREVKRLLEDGRTRAGVMALLRLRCRDWWMRACAALDEAGQGASHVDVRHDLSRDEFMSRYYLRNRPVWLPGLARDWPAVSRWTANYLATIGATVDVMFNRDQAAANRRSVPSAFLRSMPFPDFVRLVYSGRTTDNYYLVAKNRFFDVPETQVLLDDIVFSSFVMAGEGVKKVGMWFGPAGTRTPIHYDDMNTLLVQIAGRKSVRLYSPYFSEHMEQRQQWYGEVDPAAAETAGRPGLRQVTGAEVLLGAGDALFIPVGWWHVVAALDVSISLSFKEFAALNDFGSAFTPAPGAVRRDASIAS